MIQIESIMAKDNTISTHFPTNLPVFKGGNYERWIAQMNVILKFQDMAKIVSDGVPALEANVNDV